MDALITQAHELPVLPASTVRLAGLLAGQLYEINDLGKLVMAQFLTSEILAWLDLAQNDDSRSAQH